MLWMELAAGKLILTSPKQLVAILARYLERNTTGEAVTLRGCGGIDGRSWLWRHFEPLYLSQSFTEEVVVVQIESHDDDAHRL